MGECAARTALSCFALNRAAPVFALRVSIDFRGERPWLSLFVHTATGATSGSRGTTAQATAPASPACAAQRHGSLLSAS